jgi:hypothetical protein
MMDGTDLLMKGYKREKKKTCKECNGTLYKLEESVIDTYVCSKCGKTYDLDEEKDQKVLRNISKIPMYKLFPDPFMRKYTSFDNFGDFLSRCKFLKDDIFADQLSVIEDVNHRKLNGYVKKNTNFTSWDEMFEKAIDWYFHM